MYPTCFMYPRSLHDVPGENGGEWQGKFVHMTLGMSLFIMA